MRRIAPVFIALVLAAPVAAQKIKVSTDSVPVYVTVTDTDGTGRVAVILDGATP